MIKLAKLVSGEFVVGTAMDNCLTNVLKIQFSSNPIDGTMSRTLLPYMHPIVNNVGKLITYDKVILVQDAPLDIQKEYLLVMQQALKSLETKEQKSAKEQMPIEQKSEPIVDQKEPTT